MHFTQALLLPFSLAYGAGIGMRNALYDLGLRRVHRVGVPVVSIGNITVGGTGKTPLSLHLLQWLQEQGEHPAYLSRGYGRTTRGYLEVQPHGDAATYGDEPLLVKARFPHLPVAVCEDRVAGAQRLVRDHSPTLLLLDDAFQHRRIHRDLDVVVADAGRLPQQDWLLPAGRLREGIRALRRAHFLVMSKVADPAQLPHSPLPAAQTAYATLAPLALRPLAGGEGQPISALQGAPVVAFCGIGNPEPFRRSLLAAGADLRAFRSFPDHHPFTPADLQDILGIFAPLRQAPGALLVTTEKDAHRLLGSPEAKALQGVPAMALQVGWQWLGGEAGLHSRILQLTQHSK